MTPPSLQKRLDHFYSAYQSEYLTLDPLEFVKRYKSPEDQEIVAFVAAALAIGRVDLFQKATESVLTVMQPSPRSYLENFNADDWQDLEGFVYRFYRQEDIGLLFSLIHQMLSKSGSLENFFLDGYRESHPHIGEALTDFVDRIMTLNPKPFYESMPDKGKSIRHFLASPADGSSCKRLNLFLRWMIRKDALDTGIWKEIPPAKLIIPVDTHIARLGRKMKLTRRKSADWKMALEITESLRKFDPEDPVKYDFALCTIGKLNPCPKSEKDFSCPDCPIREECG